MSPLSRTIAGPLLTFNLAEELAIVRADDSYRRTGRAGRTLTKHGPVRLTLVALAEGVEVGTHHTESPLTLQPLEGRIRFRAQGREQELRAGEVLYFGPGHAQGIRAEEETALLLTLTACEGGGEGAP